MVLAFASLYTSKGVLIIVLTNVTNFFPLTLRLYLQLSTSYLYSFVRNRESICSFSSHHMLILPFNRPRWLYTQGKTDRARAILARLHSSTGDVHSPLIDLQINEIEEKIVLDGSDSMWSPDFLLSHFIKP